MKVVITCLGLPLAACVALLVGCPGATIFQDQVDSACLESDWMADAAAAIDVETDTFEKVLAHVVREVPLVDGNWADDFGDARFYGPTVLLGLGGEVGSPCLLAFGQASLDGNRELLRTGRRCWLSFWLQIRDQIMATHGLVETYQHERRAEDRALIDAVLDRMNAALQVFDLYPDELADSLLSLYGPTTHTAELAALNLRYASQVGGPRGPERVEFARRLIDAVNAQAHEPGRGIYRFSSKPGGLYLYPNVMMIVANCLAYQATEESQYLERARATFESIQPLKDPDQGNYRSPYSADLMGAQTADYSTLSSQLYLTTALYLLYECTGHDRYLAEARDVLRFVCTHLRDDDRLVHHWIDGRPANPDDPEYYCSGCNLQALHVMWYMTRLDESRPVLSD